LQREGRPKKKELWWIGASMAMAKKLFSFLLSSSFLLTLAGFAPLFVFLTSVRTAIVN
jgi:hypothetical protein